MLKSIKPSRMGNLGCFPKNVRCFPKNVRCFPKNVRCFPRNLRCFLENVPCFLLAIRHRTMRFCYKDTRGWLNPNRSLDRYSTTRDWKDNFLSSFIFLLASCFSFVLAVARYAFELTVNNLLNNLMKSVQDLMTDLGSSSISVIKREIYLPCPLSRARVRAYTQEFYVFICHICHMFM